MGMNETPASERVHIGFFGKRNAGKSSVINAVTGQDLAVVSQVKGTTTDPVYKSMELLPLGPVVMIDTPGIDDQGELGDLRVKRSYQVLNKTDAAVLVLDGTLGMSAEDRELLRRIEKKEIPWIVVLNKRDSLSKDQVCQQENRLPQGWQEGREYLWLSARDRLGVEALKERLARIARKEESSRRIIGDLLNPGDLALLVVPIDKAAPKGRLILPQQQTIRDILEADAGALVVRENLLKETLGRLGEKPRLVITDSQVFENADKDTPADIPLTSFSILFARYKGNLETLVKGAEALEGLKDGDKVLISEGCTHHRQCGDIGTVKLPAWIRKYTGKKLEFYFTSGGEFPQSLEEYSLVVHCGGCMLNEREMKYRLGCGEDQQVPITNYGLLIAYMKGILERSLEFFKKKTDGECRQK